MSQVSYYEGGDGVLEQYPLMCDDCLDVTLAEDGKEKARKRYLPGSPKAREPERKPIIAHADIKRPIRYVYILKLSDAGFYVGQTNELGIRLQEHKDGQQTQTKSKDPKLVYYECFEGRREEVNDREKKLTVLNSTPSGQRKLRRVIEEFRAPLKLLDLDI